MWTEPYLSYRYDRLSYDPPNLHCVGLFLAIVKDRAGVVIPQAQVSAEALLPWLRGFKQAEESGDWLHVASMVEGVPIFADGMHDRELDLVLMRDVVGTGMRARMLALHCGTVIMPGVLIDISEDQGVKVKRYYDTASASAHGETRRSALSVWRHKLLA